jgi:hypothetical protein
VAFALYGSGAAAAVTALGSDVDAAGLRGRLPAVVMQPAASSACNCDNVRQSRRRHDAKFIAALLPASRAPIRTLSHSDARRATFFGGPARDPPGLGLPTTESSPFRNPPESFAGVMQRPSHACTLFHSCLN